jgi:hypothetical protein
MMKQEIFWIHLFNLIGNFIDFKQYMCVMGWWTRNTFSTYAHIHFEENSQAISSNKYFASSQFDFDI